MRKSSIVVLVGISLFAVCLTFLSIRNDKKIEQNSKETQITKENTDKKDNSSKVKTQISKPPEFTLEASYSGNEVDEASIEFELYGGEYTVYFTNMDKLYQSDMLPLQAWEILSDETQAFVDSQNIIAGELEYIDGSQQTRGENASFKVRVIGSENKDVIKIIFNEKSNFRFELEKED